MRTYLTKKSEGKTHQMAAAHSTKNNGVALEDNRSSSIIQQKKNNTGLPDNLKSGMENLSGHSMDDVKVYYNSSKPAQLNAHAYAQGSNIHLASGQEKHLPHEAWHVVQQKQGRVKPTLQTKGVAINDDKGLEKEADVMGAKALQRKEIVKKKEKSDLTSLVIQAAGWNPLSTKKGKASGIIAGLGLGALGLAAAGTGGAALAIAGGIGLVGGLGYLGYKKYKNRHEHTHRNIPEPVHPVPATGRRNSVTEAGLLDTINPNGAAVPKEGLSIAHFRARFQPMVQGGNISTARLSAALPHHKAVAFPPARDGNPATEIRAGRKWEIPNPVEGGTHSIWVHTNDPRQNPPEHSGSGPIVRVQDSSGKYLSNVNHVLDPNLQRQQDALIGKGRATRAQTDLANAERTGHWTRHHRDRTNNQHIPLVEI